MPDRDDFDDLLGGLDWPVAPSAGFARELRARLHAEFAWDATPAPNVLAMPAAPIALAPRPLPKRRRVRWTEAVGIAAAILLLFGYFTRGANRPDSRPESIPAVSTGVSSGAAAMYGGDPARSGTQPGPAPALVGQLTSTVIHGSSISNSFQPVVLGHMLYRSVILDVGLTPATTEHGYRDALQALDLVTGHIVWSVSASVVGTPVATENLLFAQTIDWMTNAPTGALVAFDAKTGDVRWTMATGKSPVGTGSSPIVLNGIVYAVHPDGTGWAVDAETGTVIWTSIAARSTMTTAASPAMGGEEVETVGGDFAIGHGHLYLSNDDGDLTALDLATGARLWSFNVGQRLNLHPQFIRSHAFNDGAAIDVLGNAIGSPAQTVNVVAAVEGSSGAERWSHSSVAASFGATIGTTIAGGTALVSDSDSKDIDVIKAYDLDTGAERWVYRQNHRGPAHIGVSVIGGTGYVADAVGYVLRLDLATGGESAITFLKEGMLPSPPLIADGRIVLEQGGGTIIVLSSSPGAATPSAP